MGFNGFGILYAKYKGGVEREVADIGGKSGVVLSAKDGDILFYSDEYASTETMVVEARCNDIQLKISMPLARHIRILTEIYGYDVLKTYVDEMPVELRGAADA